MQERIGDEDHLPLWASILFGLLVAGIVVAMGYAMGSQRSLLESLRDRADTAERGQQARVAQAQAAERTRIAREMHDVLAHRISLVAMHAGTLSYRTDLTPEERATAAEPIEETRTAPCRTCGPSSGCCATHAADERQAGASPAGDQRHRRTRDEERAGGMRVSLDEPA